MKRLGICPVCRRGAALARIRGTVRAHLLPTLGDLSWCSGAGARPQGRRLKAPGAVCAHCREPEALYRSGRHAGLVRRHWHPHIPGLIRCPGSRQAPHGGVR